MKHFLLTPEQAAKRVQGLVHVTGGYRNRPELIRDFQYANYSTAPGCIRTILGTTKQKLTWRQVDTLRRILRELDDGVVVDFPLRAAQRFRVELKADIRRLYTVMYLLTQLRTQDLGERGLYELDTDRPFGVEDQLHAGCPDQRGD